MKFAPPAAPVDRVADVDTPAPRRTLRLIPGHCDRTVNLHDWIVAVRGDVVEEVMGGRGARGVMSELAAPTLDEIRAARERLAGVTLHTPLIRPSMRAPLAMIRPGYTPSSDPLEMMIETRRRGSRIGEAWSDRSARCGA